MTVTITGGIPRRINNPQEFAMANLPFQRLQILSQVFSKALEFSQEGLAIRLQFLANLGPFVRGCGAELGQQSALVRQVFIARRIEIQNQRFHWFRRILEIAQEIAVTAIWRHDHRWRNIISHHSASADEAKADCADGEEVSKYLHNFFFVRCS